MSIQGSIDMAIDRASEKGCTTFQIFTTNPRQWKSRPISIDVASRFVEKVHKSGIDPVVAHMPYLANLASPRKAINRKSIYALKLELKRCERLRIPFLVTHLGSHLGKGREAGLKNILNALGVALSEVENKVILLLENTAGTLHSMGSRFEEIQSIIEGTEQHNERIGICFDTSHAFASGYDLRNEKVINNTINHLDNVIGIKKLKVIHMNDSKGDLNSSIDRHEHIGLGRIGEKGFRVLLHEKRLQDLPFIMETPVDERRDDSGNIEKLLALAD